MGTRPAIFAPRLLALLLGAVALAGACGGSTNNLASRSASPSATSPSAPASAASSPSSSPSPAPTGPPVRPVTGAYGVLVGSPASNPYTVSIIGVDGKVVASAQASTPVVASCANTAAAVVPASPVSTSDSRVYFMDAQGAVRFLGPAGDTGQVTAVPAGTASRRSMFAVSPDDQRIAVVVDDFTQGGASTRLYVEDLIGGGHHVDLFSESGSYTLWPVGWHGLNNLVVAKVPSCTQGGGAFCCGPQELHVVDPATGTRRFTLGGGACVIAGSASPAGVVCEDTLKATVLNWTDGTVRTIPVNGTTFAYVSPDGSLVVLVDNNGSSFSIGGWSVSGMFACGWIDSDHVFSGGDTQHQPRIAAVAERTLTPVAAQGDCGGRIPGGL